MVGIDDNRNRDPLERIAEEFTDRLRRGEQATPAEYASIYPHLADDILRLFPAVELLEQVSLPS